MKAGYLLLFGSLLAGEARLLAQTVVLDEGTFRITLGGQDIGTETFWIRQNGTGENVFVIASGRLVLDSASSRHESSAEMRVAGQALRPDAYQVTVSGSDKQQVIGRVVGARFSAKILSPSGEEMREYPASDGAVIVDEGLSHHYYFLAQRVGTEGARVPVIVPRRNQQVTAQVTNRGDESVSVAGTSVPGRHLVIVVSGSERHVWVDGKGRVLRVEVPARRFVATRIAAPK